jgi:hypothetical protein
MSNTFKFMIIGAVAGLALAGPAVAQSFNPNDGSGTTSSFAYAPDTRTHYQSVQNAGGEAYAQVPERGPMARGTSTGSGYEGLLDTQGTR